MPVKNIIPGQRVTKAKLERARELRREMTPAETILWQELRGNKLGVHFRRQQVIKGFIVDFYCHKAGLIIEVDGAIHDEDAQKEYDIKREQVLNALGLRVVRFPNEEIKESFACTEENKRSSFDIVLSEWLRRDLTPIEIIDRRDGVGYPNGHT
jgi:very-short-patch-repair endonuclease